MFPLSMPSMRRPPRAVAGLALCVALSLLGAAGKPSRPAGLGGTGVANGTDGLTVAAFAAAARSLAPGGVRLTGLTVSRAPDGSLSATGTLDGAAFLLRFPAAWDHELVLFAQGYVTPGAPGGLDLPRPDEATGAVLAAAFAQRLAYGYSAYSKVGYAVRAGMEDTELLRRLVGGVARLSRTYLLGKSMGGDIAIGLVETHPRAYAGLLSYCGVVAGWYEELRYLTDFRVIYDYYTRFLGAPVALPGAGHAALPDPALSANTVVGAVGALFAGAPSRPAYARAVAGIARVSGANPDAISYITALLGDAYGLADYQKTAGGNGYGNVGKVYRGSMNDKALNAGVERIAPAPAAVAYVKANYTPTGRFGARVLSIHNTIDPLVPYGQESLFRARVAARGNEANLVQQVVAPKPASALFGGPAHCYFSPAQLTHAWDELRGWTLRGARPADGADITQSQGS
jgi:hypothetical protein